MGRFVPSAAVWAVWFAVTVPVPLLLSHASGPVESFPNASEIHMWTFVALPVLAALGALRQRHWARAFLAALITGAVSLAVSVVVFRWFVPLDEPAGWGFFRALPLALVGGVAGFAARFRSGNPPRRWRYVAGGLIAFFGLVTVTAALEVAARESVQQNGKWAAVHRYDAEESVAGCVVTGPDGFRRDVERLTVPVSWSNDGTADIWVGEVDLPAGGAGYVLSCPATEVGLEPVRVGGAVAAMVGWPWAAVWLLGAAPGLTVLADTAVRRRLHERRETRDTGEREAVPG